MKTYKTVSASTVVAISCAFAGIFAAAQSFAQVTVTAWGGAYTQSQNEAMYKPFTAKTGTKVLSEDYNGGLAEIRAQVKTGNVKWDVVDLEYAEALRGCDEGLFEKIDVAKLPKGADGASAKDDFNVGMITECGVANISFATIYSFDRTKFPQNAPKSLEDFFDLKKFPGKRGLKKGPNVLLEWALMADGVPVEQVYHVLSTSEGVDRAFRKLDTIKPSVVWWTAGAQPAQLLASGEVVMTSAYHGRIFDAATKENKPFSISWDGQIQVPDLFAVVKGSKNTTAAMEFIRFATGTKPLADQTKSIPYAPARKSSMKLVEEKTKPWLPTTAREGRSMVTNAAWWADHADELNQRFASWLAK